MPPFVPKATFEGCRRLLVRGGAAALHELRVQQAGGPENSQGRFVLYWAQSARRILNNPALDFAIETANRLDLPVVVYESLRPDYPWANDRVHRFVLDGVAANRRDAQLRGLRYVFFLPKTRAEAAGALAKLATKARLVVTDEFPTFIVRRQTRSFVAKSPVRVLTYDGNGILPMRALPGEQYSARFFRDRAHRMFDQFWCSLPGAEPRIAMYDGDLPVASWDGADPGAAVRDCAVDHTVAPVRVAGGRDAGLAVLDRFVRERLAGYAERRNREAERTSGLSPWLHFGFVGIHEVARRVLLSDAPIDDIDAFLEEAIIRRELSFNMCHFREDHDSITCLPDWARRTLDAHRDDRRKPLYELEELEAAATHDEVWNLAQQGLLVTGRIHNYLRMLWGKKIIEWSRDASSAHAVMVRLHDRWAIDGRDPNTHAGILWCLGKHDRPWAPARPIFGTIRYMSSESTRRKVDLKAYAALLARESTEVSSGKVDASGVDSGGSP